MKRDSWLRTVGVALLLCLICSILVSGMAVLLRDRQNRNKELERKKNILIAAGMYDEVTGQVVINDTPQPDVAIPELFEESTERPYVVDQLIDLETGEPIGEDAKAEIEAAFGSVEKYEQKKASNDPALSEKIDGEKDVANVKRRERYAYVYLVKKPDGSLDQVILPIRGYGLWSTLWGFIALDADLVTIRGITYYEHGETPGLGGEVDNTDWKKQWNGKLAFKDGEVAIRVIKGSVDSGSDNAKYQIDGLSGATITSKGVTNMLQYWLGEEGFGPFLKRLKNNQ